MKIVTAFDPEYLEYGAALVESVLQNTQYEIYVQLVNFEKVPLGLVNARIEGDIETHAFDSKEHKAEYCANLRAGLMKKLYGKDSLLWLDADSIVRKPLPVLEAMLRDQADTVAYKREEEPFRDIEMHQYLISTVGISTTPAAWEFLCVWEELTEKLRKEAQPATIMEVQIAYNRALRHLGNRVRFKCIGKNHTDMDFHPDSEIIEGQGRRKDHSKDFMSEQFKYLADYRIREREAERSLKHGE